MKTLDELKAKWNTTNQSTQTVDKPSLDKLLKRKVNTSIRSSMQYFWASFVLQILVYAMLTHVIVKYHSDGDIVLYALAGIVLYIPFTYVILRKFKSIAAARLQSDTTESLYAYTNFTHGQLQDFLRFKKTYELFLIPVSAAIGVIIVFNLYVPGGIQANFNGVVIAFVITLLSCAWAIHRENKQSFTEPMRKLREILDEFN